MNASKPAIKTINKKQKQNMRRKQIRAKNAKVNYFMRAKHKRKN
jgi:hypothetical protein